LVIGAGPTGLTLAASLVNRGVDARVVDAQPEGANTSRAAVVTARALKVLEGIDAAELLTAQGIHNRTFSVRDGDRTLIPVDFGDLPTKYPYSLTISQADTERVLLDRLVELGGEVLRPKTLTALAQHADGVTASFDDGDAITARYVVGADGMRSVVREHAGIGFRGHEYAEDFALADVRLHGDMPVDEILLFYATTGLNVVAPLPGGIHRIVAPVAGAPKVPSREFIQWILNTRGFGPGRSTVDDVIWGSHFRIHHRVADTYRAGRLLRRCGARAQPRRRPGHEPRNTGRAALSNVLDGAPDAASDAYSRDRRAIALQVLALTARLTRLATLPKPLRALRNTAMATAAQLPSVRNGLAWRLSGLVYR
jgi:2-polyprenyl-6-methoxyphenol hydroxylase-like FAD-dependent oxidoreductase